MAMLALAMGGIGGVGQGGAGSVVDGVLTELDSGTPFVPGPDDVLEQAIDTATTVCSRPCCIGCKGPGNSPAPNPNLPPPGAPPGWLPPGVFPPGMPPVHPNNPGSWF